MSNGFEWPVAIEDGPYREPVSDLGGARRAASGAGGVTILSPLVPRSGVFLAELPTSARDRIPADDTEYGPEKSWRVERGLKTYYLTPVPPGEAEEIRAESGEA